jgi:TorA maturation chaperone TorD
VGAPEDETGLGTGSLARFRTAVADDLRSLALLHDRELERDLIRALKNENGDGLFGLALRTERGKDALGTLEEGLADIPSELDQETMDLLAAEYADIYLNNGLGASPCESVWLDEDGLTMQEPMFQIREWYKRYGLAVADWRTRTDDHLVNQLQFVAFLMEQEPADKMLEEAACFMDEHLLRWIGGFGERVAVRSRVRFYGGLASLTAAYLDELRDLIVEVLSAPRPTPEEIEERMRPKTGLAVEVAAPFVPGSSPTW